MTRKSKEQEIMELQAESWRKSISDFNRKARVRCDELALVYRKVLIEKPKDAMDLARRISTKYPHLQVQVVYRNGHQQVFTLPVFEPFGGSDVSMPENNYQLEDLARKAEAFWNQVDSKWPPFAELAAYAAGLNEQAFELQELKKAYEHLENKYKSRVAMMPPMMMPFGGLWP